MIIKFEAKNILVETYIMEQLSVGTHIPIPWLSLLYLPVPESGRESAQLRQRTGQKRPDINAVGCTFNH